MSFRNILLVSKCDSWLHIIQCFLSCWISNIERLAASQSFLFQNEQLQSVSKSCSEDRFASFLLQISWCVCYTWEDHSLEFICYFIFQHNFKIFVALCCFCLSLKSASLKNLQSLLKQSESYSECSECSAQLKWFSHSDFSWISLEFKNSITQNTTIFESADFFWSHFVCECCFSIR